MEDFKEAKYVRRTGPVMVREHKFANTGLMLYIYIYFFFESLPDRKVSPSPKTNLLTLFR